MSVLPKFRIMLLAVLVAGCGSSGAGTAVASTAAAYPGYNTNPAPADMTGMSHDARQIAASIRIGWNIGNAMEAIGGETAWENPQVSDALIQAVKKAGFNAIRLPVSWDQYADQKTGRISAAWLNRVKQVVQYCVDNDMVVLVNAHWDGGWLERNVTSARKDAVNAKQKAYWEQIATALRDFDEHVMFASANEPGAPNAAAAAVLMSYHQTFVDAVRATGGRNAYRVLVVQGPDTDIEKTVKLMHTLPSDKVPGRMMAEIHFYGPYNFVMMDKDETWGNAFYYWGTGNHSKTDTKHNPTWGEEAHVDALFASLKRKFVDKGIPVVLGEFSAMRRKNLAGDALALHLKSRNDYHTHVVKAAVANGVLPFYWDVGVTDGIFDRKTNLVRDRHTLDAVMAGLSAK